MKNRGGQVTIFIIIAILIIAGVASYFAFRERIVVTDIPANIQEVETTFLSCLEDDVITGIDILETQGGYIEIPEFEPGSDFMPFSSQLDFLGNPIPYWYYVSGNNIPKEQVPSKELMEKHLADFIEQEVANCAFNDFYNEGYEIVKGVPEASVVIRDDEVEIDLEMDLDISFQEQSVVIQDHNRVVKSSLGSLYNSAKTIYDYEQENLFLEEYALDTLGLYAPVDGVEITCSPLTWNADVVFSELEEAIEINTFALNNFGEENDYFDVGVQVDHEVNFVNSRNWARTYEVEPSEGNILLANPVGNQPGLGILGFCYVPYHFVYNVKYPVLVQVIEDDEIFQFPMAVILQGNNPREPLIDTGVGTESIGLCENKNTPATVNVFDISSNPVDAKVSYECFGERCVIGEGSSVSDDFPQCTNGFVLVEAEGYRDSRQVFSTIQDGSSISVFLDRVYDLPVSLNLDGVEFSGQAIISFASDNSYDTIVYPDQKSIELSEGTYDVDVQIYKDSSIELGESTIEQCVDVPIGIFGLTRQNCFDVEIPPQVVSTALAGGGSQEHFVSDFDLRGSSEIEISVESLPDPSTLEQLQDNYALFEDKGVNLRFI